jgi:hypothetical protein
MENEEKAPRKKIFSEEQKAELFKGREPTVGVPLGNTPLVGNPPLAKADSPKIEEEILIRVQFKANLETQYLLNCICKKRKTSRDRFMVEMIHQEAKKENIVISINL